MMTKMKITLMILALCLPGAVLAGSRYQSVGPAQAELLQRGPGAQFCPNCGMSLVTFYRTSHAVDSAEGIRQYCSLHCLAENYANPPTGVQVVDAATLQWIPAATAIYVYGSDRPGTMSAHSKYAFAEPADADEFIAQFGGSRETFATVFDRARAALADENLKIAAKRARMAVQGQKILATLCGGISRNFDSVAAAKTWLAQEEPCGKLREEQLQAVALALVLAPGPQVESAPIDVPERSRCVVCGMFVAKYPGWVAQVTISSGEVYYFDGVKDLAKFMLSPGEYGVEDSRTVSQWTIRVTDYYSQRSIEARTAFYVLGSNVFGPMGNELIPFGDRAEAEVFLGDHAGKQILKFEEIDQAVLRRLDS